MSAERQQAIPADNVFEKNYRLQDIQLSKNLDWRDRAGRSLSV
jgi:hypothetical protein